ncbi:mandelate racemase/muconate lactonizing enzyme family protein [Paenibacillus sp. BC26]|uniref:mandelate racemase/muconate lactonizing enzyme family protein n=1 Tax=Paenibacillus sp. BC26 TaxID=1881032 RepID=UPI0008EDDEB2|nr:mandelate racemase/muconate lactonizing enzyme family protein [Paenibacillus sp. BC26]SFT00275.1 L-alanine-DL-glutamate epimerase [Paenibacillus sp. BC26]
MRITNIETFTVRLAPPPTSPDDLRVTSVGLTRIQTDQGITGYGFRLTDASKLEQQVKPRLLGKSPLDIEAHLQSGALAGCPSVEHALWDIAGKAAGLPVRSLLGSARESMPYYLTCVWPGESDQSHIAIEDQAEQLIRYYEMGHKRFKIRAWRPDPMDDVRVLEHVRKRIGGRDKVELMLDRTAHLPGWIWTYEQALQVARGLEAVDANWLEEPFARDDLASYRRLAEEVDLPITGGEFAQELPIFRDYLVHQAVDILQPDAAISGGVWPCRKAGILAEAFGVPCILHGTSGLDWTTTMQVGASIASCSMLEYALIFPPLTPEETVANIDRILKTPGLFTFKDGEVMLPKAPGLGIEFDEEAIEALRER